MVKNPPANAGDMDSIPGPGRSYMPWSNWIHVPQLLKSTPTASAPQQEKPLQWEAWISQLQKAYVQQWRPSVAKKQENVFWGWLLREVESKGVVLGSW